MNTIVMNTMGDDHHMSDDHQVTGTPRQTDRQTYRQTDRQVCLYFVSLLVVRRLC